MIKPYSVVLSTVAKVYIMVDAEDEDEAIDIAISMIDRDEVELGEWEVDDVSIEYER